MKLKEFIKNIDKLVKKNPEALEFDVITSKDAEGNNYMNVYYKPSIGFFDGQDFLDKDNTEEEEFNSVCIN